MLSLGTREIPVLVPDSWAEIQSLVTIITMVVAGIWTYLLFVKNREKYPGASIAHSFDVVELPDDRIFIHVAVEVQNVGKTLVEIEKAKIWLQQILPVNDNGERALDNHDPSGRDAAKLISWPGLAIRDIHWRDKPAEIEPNESDRFDFEFVLSSDVQVIKVYTFFENSAKSGREIGWSHTTILDLGSITMSRAESIEVKSRPAIERPVSQDESSGPEPQPERHPRPGAPRPERLEEKELPEQAPPERQQQQEPEPDFPDQNDNS